MRGMYKNTVVQKYKCNKTNRGILGYQLLHSHNLIIMNQVLSMTGVKWLHAVRGDNMSGVRC